MNRYVALNQSLTVMYTMIEVARWGPAVATSNMRQVISKQAYRAWSSTLMGCLGGLEPDFLQFLTELIAKTRWQDAPWLPFTRVPSSPIQSSA